MTSELLKDTNLIEELRAENYDFGLSTAYDNCGLALFDLLNVRATATFIATLPPQIFLEAIGVPTLPAYMTDPLFPATLNAKYSFSERVFNTLASIGQIWRLYELYEHETALFKSANASIRGLSAICAVKAAARRILDMWQLTNQLSYVFANANAFLDFNRFYSDKLKFICGVGQQQNRRRHRDLDASAAAANKTQIELPAEYATIFAEAQPAGVILFSLGSVVKMRATPTKTRHALLEALASFTDYTIIFKHEEPPLDADFVRNFSNLHLRAWIPQPALLG